MVEGTGVVFQSCCVLKPGRAWWRGKHASWYHGRRRDRILHAYAERWIRSIKEEALSRLILFAERALWHAVTEYVTHFHEERPHQGKGNVVLLPSPHPIPSGKAPSDAVSGSAGC